MTVLRASLDCCCSACSVTRRYSRNALRILTAAGPACVVSGIEFTRSTAWLFAASESTQVIYAFRLRERTRMAADRSKECNCKRIANGEMVFQWYNIKLINKTLRLDDHLRKSLSLNSASYPHWEGKWIVACKLSMGWRPGMWVGDISAVATPRMGSVVRYIARAAQQQQIFRSFRLRIGWAFML